MSTYCVLVVKGGIAVPEQVRVDLGPETLADISTALQAIKTKKMPKLQKEKNFRHTLPLVFFLASCSSSQLNLTVCSGFLPEASYSPTGRDLRHPTWSWEAPPRHLGWEVMILSIAGPISLCTYNAKHVLISCCCRKHPQSSTNKLASSCMGICSVVRRKAGKRDVIPSIKNYMVFG